MKPTIISIAAYAVKMLAMPGGTRFELDGQKVGRIAYTAKTSKFLWNAAHPDRRTIRRRWRTSRLYQRFEAAHCRAATLGKD